jgi:hypothetical protein
LASKLGIFRNKLVNEKISEKIKRLLGESKNLDNNDNDNHEQWNLEKEAARLRHEIAKLWILDIPLSQKSKQILELMKSESLCRALSAKQRQNLLIDHGGYLDEFIERNKNKNMEMYKDNYDSIPGILKHYSNLGLTNYSRHMDLVLNDMTSKEQIESMSIENRIEVRADICNNLNIPLPTMYQHILEGRVDALDEQENFNQTKNQEKIEIFTREADLSQFVISRTQNVTNNNSILIRRSYKINKTNNFIN